MLAIFAFSPAKSQSNFGHFHPKGKPPSEHTLKVFEEARQTLPFSDRQDFAEWERGFIARHEDLKIIADAGNVAWDMERYLFLDEPEKIDSVHPSLPSSIRTFMAITLSASAVLLAWKMSQRARSKSLRRATSWTFLLPKMSMPEMQ